MFLSVLSVAKHIACAVQSLAAQLHHGLSLIDSLSFVTLFFFKLL